MEIKKITMLTEANPNDELLQFVLNSSQFKVRADIVRPFLTTFIDAIIQKSDFEISLRDVCEWLGKDTKRQDNIVRYLSEENGFKLSVDYIIEKSRSSIPKKAAKLEYWLTIDCFKRLCRKLKGENTGMILKYFDLMEHTFRSWSPVIQ